MKAATISNDLVGAAGVHFAAYRLSLRGLIVLPTIRNTAGADLLVWNPVTNTHSAVQVKASMKKVMFWPTSRPDKTLRGAGNIFIFLRFEQEKQEFEGFLAGADDVARVIEGIVADQRARGRQEFPCWALPREHAQVEALRHAWDTWTPM